MVGFPRKSSSAPGTPTKTKEIINEQVTKVKLSTSRDNVADEEPDSVPATNQQEQPSQTTTADQEVTTSSTTTTDNSETSTNSSGTTNNLINQVVSDTFQRFEEAFARPNENLAESISSINADALDRAYQEDQGYYKKDE